MTEPTNAIAIDMAIFNNQKFKKQLTVSERLIVAYIAINKKGGNTTFEISDALGISIQTVRRAIKHLTRRGFIRIAEVKRTGRRYAIGDVL